MEFTSSINVTLIFEVSQIFKLDLVEYAKRQGQEKLQETIIGKAEFYLADIAGSINNFKLLEVLREYSHRVGKCAVRMERPKRPTNQIFTFFPQVNHIPKMFMFTKVKSILKIFKRVQLENIPELGDSMTSQKQNQQEQER